MPLCLRKTKQNEMKTKIKEKHQRKLKNNLIKWYAFRRSLFHSSNRLLFIKLEVTFDLFWVLFSKRFEDTLKKIFRRKRPFLWQHFILQPPPFIHLSITSSHLLYPGNSIISQAVYCIKPLVPNTASFTLTHAWPQPFSSLC